MEEKEELFDSVKRLGTAYLVKIGLCEVQIQALKEKHFTEGNDLSEEIDSREKLKVLFIAKFNEEFLK
jgi:hypothetical protein